MKFACLFPGQGSQAAGMGRDLYEKFPVARQVFEAADAALGYPLSQICFDGPEEKLKLTEITQPAILTVSVAAYRVLQEKGVGAPTFVAGHSLGEYSAHVAAGTIRFIDAVKTVRQRGKYMQEAVPVGTGAMAAILGMTQEVLEGICREAAGDDPKAVAPSNINSPSQVVISGKAEAVQRAADLAKARGAKRAVMLPVSAPFHCALMQPAQDRLAHDLHALKFKDPTIPVIKNIDAEPATAADEARTALIRQVTGAVQWAKTVERLFAEGVTHFLEIGPGKVLCGLTGQVGKGLKKDVHCSNVEDSSSLEQTLSFLRQ